ncbi:pyridoxal phosphate-dependent aminotransferase [Anaeromicropila herbilytica]|uniref:Threonine-phosphate decarboxylase n=1 Tax=Anaeromicropila herbilytica TaxID=2785025 RepID=A0A7R7EQ52_9FIRM|nr:histidinol-phosphate transaminase [Anaeromicropila herbilytica]BCN32966.1 threonine-phosphate decarboxylase [Anaeromicropila herbilytica]
MNNMHGGDIYSYQNITDFSTNINPLGIPKAVKDAVIDSLAICNQYPDVRHLSLRKSLSEKDNIDIPNIICGNGAADLIFSLCLALKPKKALLLAPTFSEYEQALHAVDCSIIYYKLLEENQFELQTNFLDNLTNDLDIVFLCNPNNPTGHVIKVPFLNEILSLCEKKNIFLVIDECFNDFLDNPSVYTIKDCVSKHSHLFVLKAFTKLYAIPGLRLGYGYCSNTKLLDRMHQVSQPWSVSIPALAAGVAALKEDEYVTRTRALIREEREYLTRELPQYGLSLFESKANYIFFKGPSNFYENMLSEGYLIRDCSNYPGLSKGYYRIAVKSHPENVQLLEKVRKLWRNQ